MDKVQKNAKTKQKPKISVTFLTP